MKKKPDATQHLVPTMPKAFYGTLTLRDMGAFGIKDISVVVTGNDGLERFLTIIKGPGQQNEWMQGENESFIFLLADSLVPRVIPYDCKEGKKYTDPLDGCRWLVESIKPSDDKIELTARCTGTKPSDREPKCPYINERRILYFIPSS